MFDSKPRGSRIVYVASSARELPEDVQHWLGQPEHRAANSPNIYDALARLAGGARPALLIVSIEAVDWSEMEFFDRAARLSRETAIYAVGPEHHGAKLEAAGQRGARRFDPEAMEDDLAAPPPWSRSAGVSDILAGSLLPDTQRRPSTPVPAVRPVVSEPVEEEPIDAAPPSRPVQPATPAVRLVTPTEHEVEPEAEPSVELEQSGEPIPFPWSPSVNRPQRTPPKPQAADIKPAAPPSGQAAPSGPPRQPVELTADELAALMGRPVTTEQPAKEGLG